MKRRGFRYIDHPSDLAIEVEGASLEELFLNAAEAMLSAMSEDDMDAGGADAITKRIHLHEANTEELLHSFLSEILWCVMQEGYFPLTIGMDSVNGKELDAVLSGIAVHNEMVKVEIKAVTYHQLQIREKNGKLHTRIIFDV